MKLPGWLSRLGSRLRRKDTRKPRPAGNVLRCRNCECRIHRHDRWRVTEAEHLDCRDPKLTGQQSLEGA